MKLDVAIEERFEEPIDEVWQAITDPAVIARWLMDNDFEARVGKRFTLRRASDVWTGVIRCEVLELAPPHRMVWSWAAGDEPEGRPSRVVFELRAEGTGTVLTLRHTGDADDRTGDLFARRWPVKLAELSALLGAGDVSNERRDR
jgi:uncharacterized protein YndB with AHSA1/START domain